MFGDALLRHRGDGGPELSATVEEQEKPRGMTVSFAPAPFRMTPVGYAAYAEQFLKAAQSIPKEDKESTPVPYYLYCRALELILKSFLLLKGHELSKLRKKYGHNLKALWKAAGKDGLADAVPELPSEIGSVLALAKPYYKGKAFEYFDFSRRVHGYMRLPSLDRLGDSTAMLIEHLKPYCIRETRLMTQVADQTKPMEDHQEKPKRKLPRQSSNLDSSDPESDGFAKT